ncbi:GNAT family N-acetyltransferase [Bradyrhizobium genosp. P]|uniref:GNAT family N-acetyltransferase n=1 Tax=Bradyrhizobium genosp. P TaxID=83641 RepID=UPI003CFAD8B8
MALNGSDVHGAGAPSSSPHPLDRVIWEALVSRHKSLAQGDDRARRYPAAFGPFGATVDATPDSYRSLVPLLPPGDRLAFFTVEEVSTPPELTVVKRDLVDQMVLAAQPPGPGATPLVTLGTADISEMRALVDLTNPGPFGPRTIELGRYLGVRENGRLVAMTGERMKLDGFTEISAVCVHPSHRGTGLAAELIGAVVRAIVFSHEVPFLHVFASNTPAIALYQKLGFVRRSRMHLTVLQNTNR